jgi:hypothetical protein
MANFEVKTEQRPGEVVVRLSGDLDLKTFDAVHEVLTNVQSNGNRSVRIDLRVWSSSIRPGSDSSWPLMNGRNAMATRCTSSEAVSVSSGSSR